MKQSRNKRGEKPEERYRRARPLIVLLGQPEGDETTFLSRIDVLAWNIDGSGRALCRTYHGSIEDPVVQLETMAGDLGAVLSPDTSSPVWVEAPEGYRGERIEADQLGICDETYDDSDPTWGHACVPWASDASMARATYDARRCMIEYRRSCDAFDEALADVGLQPREHGEIPAGYGDCDHDSKDARLVSSAWAAACEGKPKRCRKLLRRLRRRCRRLRKR